MPSRRPAFVGLLLTLAGSGRGRAKAVVQREDLVGRIGNHTAGPGKTRADIAVARRVGYVELVAAKRKNPSWGPPPSVRAERPELPGTVPPGPDSPLGAYG